ncbi:MAG TPA: hypothetical protein VMW01_07120 [Williamwhitmania sp.]|nr:hypothetical protein [Williamwhitmania sp.]
MTQFFYYLINGVFFFTIIAIIIGLIRYRKLDGLSLIIFYYLVYSFVNGVVMFVYGELGMNNLFYYNSDIVIEFVILGAFFWFSSQHKWFRRGIVTSGAIFVVVFLSTFNSKLGYLNLLKMVETISIFLGGLTLTIQENSKTDKLSHSPRFWISAGLMIYSAPTFLIAAASNQILLLPKEQAFIIWALNSIFYGIMILFICIAFLRCSKT